MNPLYLFVLLAASLVSADITIVKKPSLGENLYIHSNSNPDKVCHILGYERSSAGEHSIQKIFRKRKNNVLVNDDYTLTVDSALFNNGGAIKEIGCFKRKYDTPLYQVKNIKNPVFPGTKNKFYAYGSNFKYSCISQGFEGGIYGIYQNDWKFRGKVMMQPNGETKEMSPETTKLGLLWCYDLNEKMLESEVFYDFLKTQPKIKKSFYYDEY